MSADKQHQILDDEEYRCPDDETAFHRAFFATIIISLVFLLRTDQRKQGRKQRWKLRVNK